jgi:molybdopterin-guanine dinucleotide biosynthesis protein A
MDHTPLSRLVAVILAGRSSKEEDLLAPYSGQRPKGLIPIAGRPMVSYVVEALAKSRAVQDILIIGLDEDPGPLCVPVVQLPDQGNLLLNTRLGIQEAHRRVPELDGVLVSSADLPLVTTEIVDGFIAQCRETQHELYYGIVERSVMEARFPASRRTYVGLADGEFAGCDMFLMRAGTRVADEELWQRLASARKNPIRQARMLGGVWPLMKLLARRMSVSEVERRASEALRIHGRAVICPYPEMGMDVDKPFQLEIARAELEARAGASAG